MNAVDRIVRVTPRLRYLAKRRLHTKRVLLTNRVKRTAQRFDLSDQQVIPLALGKIYRENRAATGATVFGQSSFLPQSLFLTSDAVHCVHRILRGLLTGGDLICVKPDMGRIDLQLQVFCHFPILDNCFRSNAPITGASLRASGSLAG